MAKSPAWQRKEGKSDKGGLNAKGRASYNKANPGKPGLKAPQPEGGPRKASFCARMTGNKYSTLFLFKSSTKFSSISSLRKMLSSFLEALSFKARSSILASGCK